MKTKMETVETHTTVFMCGKNFGSKIAAKDGIMLEFEHETDKLLIHFKGRTAIVPMGNVAWMVPFPSPPKKAQD